VIESGFVITIKPLSLERKESGRKSRCMGCRLLIR